MEDDKPCTQLALLVIMLVKYAAEHVLHNRMIDFRLCLAWANSKWAKKGRGGGGGCQAVCCAWCGRLQADRQETHAPTKHVHHV